MKYETLESILGYGSLVFIIIVLWFMSEIACNLSM